MEMRQIRQDRVKIFTGQPMDVEKKINSWLEYEKSQKRSIKEKDLACSNYGGNEIAIALFYEQTEITYKEDK